MAELIMTEEGSTPTTPASTKWKLYPKSDGYYFLDDAGKELGPLVSANGWIPGTGTWSYSSADSPSFVASIPDADAALMQIGDRIKLTQTTAKYFIITKIGTPSGGFTPVTMYGGTDYTLANAAITSPFWSHAKSPLGFPMSPAKWTVTVVDTTQRTQATPTQNTWYNLGTTTISVPIGAWKVTYKTFAQVVSNAAQTAVTCFTTLSTANNTESDPDFTGGTQVGGASATIISGAPVYIEKHLEVTSKTTYYLNTRTTLASMASIHNRNDLSKLVIDCVCVYL
jgi:hypothetical protein